MGGSKGGPFFPEVACNVPHRLGLGLIGMVWFSLPRLYLRLEVLAPNMGPCSRLFRGILGTLRGTYRM